MTNQRRYTIRCLLLIKHDAQIACLHTYLFHAAAVLLVILTRFQLVKKLPAYYGTLSFITAIKMSASVSILSQLDPVHNPKFHFLQIHFNIIPINTSVSQVVSFPQFFPPKPCTHLPSPHTIFNVLA